MRPPIPEEVKRYAEWHKAAYGWNPFEPLKCAHCGIDVYLGAVYRCYDCNLPMHKECLIAHCGSNPHKEEEKPNCDDCFHKKERLALLELTRTFIEHPEDYDGPCECQTCMSYGD